MLMNDAYVIPVKALRQRSRRALNRPRNTWVRALMRETASVKSSAERTRCQTLGSCRGSSSTLSASRHSCQIVQEAFFERKLCKSWDLVRIDLRILCDVMIVVKTTMTWCHGRPLSLAPLAWTWLSRWIVEYFGSMSGYLNLYSSWDREF